MKLYKILAVLACLFTVSSALAQVSQRTATIRGKNQVVVTKSKVILSDIAEITAENSDAHLALSKIEITNSPKPGASIDYAAQKVLEALQMQGVDLNKVGYVFNPSINIRRAARTLSEPEVEAAVQAAMAQEDSEAILKSVQLPRNAQVFTGPITMQAELRNPVSANSTQRQYTLTLTNSEGERLSLDGRVEIDSWKQVPVATRSLTAGSILEALDFGLARLNTKDLPKDVAFGSSELIGKKIQREIGVGQVFRVSSLERPPLIKSGARVTILVRAGALEATASGVALEDGFEGDNIQVRNDTSRRVVNGSVKDQTTVEVLQ